MVLGVPRSASSMLARALATSRDIDAHIFQPFYEQDDESDLDKKLQEAKGEREPTPDRPFRVLLKIMAESLTGQRFTHVARHTENVVVVLRDPQSQFLSTCRAIWQLPSGKASYAAEVASFKRVQMKDHKGILENYIVTPWQRMENHVAQLQNLQEIGGPTWCVVDGDALRAAPSHTLRAMCTHFGMGYTSAMVHSWSRSGEKTVGLQDDRYKKSWLGRVQHTTSIHKPTLMTPRLEDLSGSVRPQVEANLRIYVKLLACNRRALPSKKQLESMMRHGFAETSPIACYSLAAISHDEAQRNAVLASIRERMPDYVSSYDLIDATLARLRAMGKVDESAPPSEKAHSTRHVSQTNRAVMR